ncbi:MAG: peptidase C14 [Phormidesmis priestleyi]|uniref:Peptidase C14 n=1 Tax=Phormidesmis priestleyi TaxID=268141 RepID=A0A2W4XY88_9CYAN|nr:MAG: peptidase C14 [Phormidesmis priestleyi]
MSKNWAICIGINEYYNLTPLQYAVRDAVAMRDFFLKEVAFEQVFYFADDSPPIATPHGPMRSVPTYANLKRFFRELFQQQVLSVGDNVWFFFAGHGELHEGHDYLMPVDVDPGNVDETALKISDITASLRNSGADNTVLLLDACRSQGRRSPVGFGSETQKGIVTFYACSPRQSSYEIEELQQGAFTHALLESFQLMGADSCATVERIDQYLRHRVPSLNQQYQKQIQTPYTAVEPLSKNCLILLPDRARLVDVQALKISAYRAERGTDLNFAEQLWIRVLAASPNDSEALEAIKGIAVKQAQQTLAESYSSPTTAGTRSIDAPVTEQRTAFQSPPAVQPVNKVQRVAFPKVPDVAISGEAKGDPSSQRIESRCEALGQGVSLELIPIPGGTFQMGSPEGQGNDDERPQHQVTIKPFLMGKYPVTQAQWKAVAAWPKVQRDLVSDPAYFKGDNCPVEEISWDEAVEFCERLSHKTGRQYRLPSEAEWEYACRAGTKTHYHFGDAISGAQVGIDFLKNAIREGSILGLGLYEDERETYRAKTMEVGCFPVNAFGLYDMHGNVWEWCLDHWHNNYEGASTDGSAWIKGGKASRRLLRGGSWNNIPRYCRSAYRSLITPDDRDDDVGFRVSCSAPRTLV